MLSSRPDNPRPRIRTATHRGAAQIEAALVAAPIEELSILVGELGAAGVALDKMVANMQHHAGPQYAPDFAALAKPLARIRKVLTKTSRLAQPTRKRRCQPGWRLTFSGGANGMAGDAVSVGQRTVLKLLSRARKQFAL